ncbi:hypothetical protein ACJX0J_019328, partial [Zea mays]
GSVAVEVGLKCGLYFVAGLVGVLLNSCAFSCLRFFQFPFTAFFASSVTETDLLHLVDMGTLCFTIFNREFTLLVSVIENQSGIVGGQDRGEEEEREEETSRVHVVDSDFLVDLSVPHATLVTTWKNCIKIHNLTMTELEKRKGKLALLQESQARKLEVLEHNKPNAVVPKDIVVD